MDIKTGMVVWLKSGSPAMTVGDEMNNNSWRCHWFVGGELKKAEFHPRELTDNNPFPEIDMLPVSGG